MSPEQRAAMLQVLKSLDIGIEDAIIGEDVSVNDRGITLRGEAHDTYLKLHGEWFRLWATENGGLFRDNPTSYQLAERLGFGVIDDPSKAYPMKAFLGVVKKLSGGERKPVERQALLKELMHLLKLTEEEANGLIRQAYREGLIYESKPGYVRSLV